MVAVTLPTDVNVYGPPETVATPISYPLTLQPRLAVTAVHESEICPAPGVAKTTGEENERKVLKAGVHIEARCTARADHDLAY